MKNLLLIKLKEPFREKQKPCYVPPIGLWSIRTYVESKTDVSVDICDEHIGDDLMLTLEQKEYNMFGVSCQFSIQHEEYKRVVSLLKKLFPNIPIYSGGFHASAIKKLSGVEEVCHGEGEFFMMEKLGFKVEGKNITSIPYPLFDRSEIEKYWNKKAPHDLESKTEKWMTIETSRGCNRNCSFCGVPNYWGRWRFKTSSAIDEYCKYLKEKGVEEIFIEDDNLSLSKNRFIELIDIFKKYDILWSTPNGIQASTIYNEEVLSKLENSTCWKLSLPFETGTETGRDLMNLKGKWLNFEKANDLVTKLNNIGIETVGFFIIGYPGETIYDIKRTLNYANKLPLNGRHIHIAIPYPGTPLYDECKRKEYIANISEEELYQELLVSNGLISTENFTAEEVEQIKKKDRDEAIARKKANIHEGSSTISSS